MVATGPIRGVIREQMAVARSGTPGLLIKWANDGVFIHREAWETAIRHWPTVFASMPLFLKTSDMCRVAMAADPMLFVKVPTRFQTEEFEELYNCHCRRLSATPPVPSTSPAPAVPALETASGENRAPVIINVEDSEDKEDYEEEPDDNEISRSGRKRAVDVRKPASTRKAAKTSARLGLSNFRAVADGATVPSQVAAASGLQRLTIDMSIIEKLKGAGRRFGKLFQLANDPNAPEGERANAKRKVESALENKNDDVLEALKVLQETVGKQMISIKPALVQVRIMFNGVMATKQFKWMGRLATSIHTQYFVGHVIFRLYNNKPGITFGFHGNEALVIAAAEDYTQTFNWLASVAPDHAFAQGFADESCRIQKCFAKARGKEEETSTANENMGAAATSTAIVVRSNKDLVNEALRTFYSRVWKTRPPRGASRTHPNYKLGQKAAHARSRSDAKRDQALRLCNDD